jgi:hypothetical protein
MASGSFNKVYMVQETNRKYYRKTTNLTGLYQKLNPPFISGKILVTDLSFTGCGFDAPTSHSLHSDDRIRITFSLNDVQGSMIRKDAIVRKVEGNAVGCQFITLPGSYDPDLGFYLRNP